MADTKVEVKAETKGDAKDGDNKKEDDDLPKDELKPHLFGHHFHWSEIFFILMVGAGAVFFIIPSAPFMGIIACSVYAAVGGIATSLVWNLISIKRIAAAAAMLEGDVKAFKAENERAKGMQAEKRKQDAEMKEKIGDLQKAELLLKGSVNGLEGIQKQEEEMLKEREELLVHRRDLAAKLEKDMADLWKSTIQSATEELCARAELYFAESDADGDGITVGSDEWTRLSKLMEKNGIKLDAAAAGEDGNMQEVEFQDFLDKTLKTHFTNLEQALRDCEKISAEILEEKMRRL
jgi:uncharacterized protein YlxW (UPF0749 family)